MDVIKEIFVKGVELDAEAGVAFIQYFIEVTLSSGEVFKVLRRYKQILQFHAEVAEALNETGHADLASSLPKLPGKSVYGNLTNKVITPRLYALTPFLARCLELSEKHSVVAIKLNRFLRRPTRRNSEEKSSERIVSLHTKRNSLKRGASSSTSPPNTAPSSNIPSEASFLSSENNSRSVSPLLNRDSISRKDNTTISPPDSLPSSPPPSPPSFASPITTPLLPPRDSSLSATVKTTTTKNPLQIPKSEETLRKDNLPSPPPLPPPRSKNVIVIDEAGYASLKPAPAGREMFHGRAHSTAEIPSPTNSRSKTNHSRHSSTDLSGFSASSSYNSTPSTSATTSPQRKPSIFHRVFGVKDSKENKKSDSTNPHLSVVEEPTEVSSSLTTSLLENEATKGLPEGGDRKWKNKLRKESKEDESSKKPDINNVVTANSFSESLRSRSTSGNGRENMLAITSPINKVAKKRSVDDETERDNEIEKKLQNAEAPSAAELHTKHLVLLQLLYAPQISANGRVNQSSVKRHASPAILKHKTPDITETPNIPKWVPQAFEYIENNASELSDLFWTKAEKEKVNELYTQLSTKEFKKELFIKIDPYLLADVILAYFRRNEGSQIFPVSLYEELIAATLPREDAIDDALLCNLIKDQLKLIHPDRRNLLVRLCCCAAALKKVKLSLFAYTFGPHVLRPPSGSEPSLVDVNAVNMLVEVLIVYKDIIFFNKTPTAEDFLLNRSKISTRRVSAPTAPSISNLNNNNNSNKGVNSKFGAYGIDEGAVHRKNSSMANVVVTRQHKGPQPNSSSKSPTRSPALSPVAHNKKALDSLPEFTFSEENMSALLERTKRKTSTESSISITTTTNIRKLSTESSTGGHSRKNSADRKLSLEETRALKEEVAALKSNLQQQQAAQNNWGKSIQAILLATAFSSAASAKYHQAIQTYLLAKVADLTSWGIDDPKIEVTQLSLPSNPLELPLLQLINFSQDDGVQWMIDWKSQSFKLDLHLEGRKVVKFTSDVQVMNIFLAGVIWLKILPDSSLTVCFHKLPAVSFDISVNTKVGIIPISIENQMKKWLEDKLRSYLTKNLVYPNWKLLPR